MERLEQRLQWASRLTGVVGRAVDVVLCSGPGDVPNPGRFSKAAVGRVLKTETRTNADGDEERVALIVVAEPGVPDADEDYYEPEDIRYALKSFAFNGFRVDDQHDGRERDVVTIQSWQTLDETTINDETIRAGSWLVERDYSRADEQWSLVKSGQRGGVSIGGSGEYVLDDGRA